MSDVVEKPACAAPVAYDGEFVLTEDGSVDFGEIPPAVARLIRRQAGKIRLKAGFHSDEAAESAQNYGEAHIERAGRLKQLQQAGFRCARDFVAFTAKHYNVIYAGGGRSLKICCKSERNYMLFVQLEPCSSGDFYDVKTAMITRKSYLKNETPLWTKPQAEPVR